eukprot:TRINITY_DN10524_c0_g1_i1.p1 TRINITY_DN10524_c0_g1~~TRINITY_DN10524_c0_g1_i1.p1  ORF type:complete len:143 (-),score=29.98 TRINITY_DN10524_c0_g1_i1:140-568(-)
MSCFYCLGFLVLLFGISLPLLGLTDSAQPPRETTWPNFTITYVREKGAFTKIPNAFTHVKEKLISIYPGFNTSEGVGVFFDNPDVVQEVRWWIGFVLPDALNTTLKAKLVDLGLGVTTVPESRVVGTTFSWKSILSPMYGPR